MATIKISFPGSNKVNHVEDCMQSQYKANFQTLGSSTILSKNQLLTDLIKIITKESMLFFPF
jgi:hypothetical protein